VIQTEGLPRRLVFADMHLVPHTPRAAAADLARVVDANPGARLHFLGDLFDLPAASPRKPHREAVVDALGAHPDVRAALGRHLDGGGELWLVGGNHDAEVGTAGFTEHLVAALGASPSACARVRASPWFFRDGGLHLEHGHLYDPDNTPAHPLVKGRPSLGVHFVEEFVAPTNAHHYLNVNDSTPLKLFLASFTTYGRRAPYVIYRYFHAAIGAMLTSGPFYRASSEVPEGLAKHDAYARELGVKSELVDALLALGAKPTLESLSRTFSRVYFDRVIATLTIVSGLGVAAAGGGAPFGALAGLGALLMVASWANGHNRYGGAVRERLSDSAARIADTTGARLVLFGHTHHEVDGERYANPGSFAFPGHAPGRPFLEIEGTEDAPRAIRRYWRSGIAGDL
jgi:UDP-2,3-diacylglucosamine pyrophosphatase LpxH